MYPNRNFKVQIYQWRQRGDKKAALIAEGRIISAVTVGINKRAAPACEEKIPSDFQRRITKGVGGRNHDQ